MLPTVASALKIVRAVWLGFGAFSVILRNVFCKIVMGGTGQEERNLKLGCACVDE